MAQTNAPSLPLLRAYRQENYEGHSLLADLARAGYLCMAIDALGFGERLEIGPFEELDRIRRQMTGREAETFRVERIEREYQKTFRSLSSVGLSTAAVIATDDMRCIDYLASREDVDAGRIGCGGLSMGSFRSHYLAALDERIRATVSVCWVSIHAGVVDFNLPNSMRFFALPGSLYADYDLIDLPIVAAPRPFLAISGWHDILMEPQGMTEAHRILRRAWETAGAPECLGSLVFDAPHTFNREMQERALAFYHRFLV